MPRVLGELSELDIDLESILREYCEVKSAGGDEIRLQDCPVCGNGKYKLYVNVSKHRWNCFVCSFGKGIGDVAVLISEVSGRHITDVRKELYAGHNPLPEDGFLEKLSGVLEDNEDFEYQELNFPGQEFDGGVVSRSVLDYVYSRGLTYSDVTNFGIKPAYKIDSISGPFMVVPIFYNGAMLSWQGRRVRNMDPRYVSHKNVKNCLWPDPIEAKGSVCLVEGTFDAIGLQRLGYSAFCTFGKAISASQIKLLRDNGVKHITYAWDADAVWQVSSAVQSTTAVFDSIKIANFVDSPWGVKKDPGDGLVDSAVADWVKFVVDSAMDVGSNDFFNWKMNSGFE